MEKEDVGQREESFRVNRKSFKDVLHYMETTISNSLLCYKTASERLQMFSPQSIIT